MSDFLEEEFLKAASTALQTQVDENFMISGRLNQIVKTLTDVFGEAHPIVTSLRLKAEASLGASVVLDDINQTLCRIAASQCDISIDEPRKMLQ
ncbi:MAG: hypothetical protein J0L77_07965 [Alphaproteobacteria bacterium]|nr:hypothetical protein [Alphaproteobacteria bacterium]